MESGVGGRIVRFTWREIADRIRDQEHRLRIANDGNQRAGRPKPVDMVGRPTPGEMPEAIQFLHFDLPTEFDGYKDPNVPRVLSLDDKLYVPLANPNYDYKAYDQALLTEGRLPAAWPWRPRDPDSIPAPSTGAGQRRSVGRVVAISTLEDIDQQLKLAASDLTSATVNDSVTYLDRLFNLDRVQTQKAGHVFVIGSLAGGSGSGLVLDVIERVKASTLSWFSNVHLIAITPDAFPELSASEASGNQPNALAAISEYTSAFLWEGPLPKNEAIVHGSLGKNTDGRRTGDRAFLIGIGNEKLGFRASGEVFRSLGKSLAVFATTPTIQDFFDTVVCNLRGSRANPGAFYAERGDSVLQPVSSFGFGSLSVGGEHLREYAAQRLANGCLDRLLCETPAYFEPNTSPVGPQPQRQNGSLTPVGCGNTTQGTTPGLPPRALMTRL